MHSGEFRRGVCGSWGAPSLRPHSRGRGANRPSWPRGIPRRRLTALSLNHPSQQLPIPSSAAWSTRCSQAMPTSTRLYCTPRNCAPIRAASFIFSVTTATRAEASTANLFMPYGGLAASGQGERAHLRRIVDHHERPRLRIAGRGRQPRRFKAALQRFARDAPARFVAPHALSSTHQFQEVHGSPPRQTQPRHRQPQVHRQNPAAVKHLRMSHQLQPANAQSENGHRIGVMKMTAAVRRHVGEHVDRPRQRREPQGALPGHQQANAHRHPSQAVGDVVEHEDEIGYVVPVHSVAGKQIHGKVDAQRSQIRQDSEEKGGPERPIGNPPPPRSIHGPAAAARPALFGCIAPRPPRHGTGCPLA